jgi:hypothetical protein
MCVTIDNTSKKKYIEYTSIKATSELFFLFIIGSIKEPLKYCNIFVCSLSFSRILHLFGMLCRNYKMNFLYFFIYVIYQCHAAGIMDNVVFAVNCGGEAHTDMNGRKERDCIVIN